MLILAAVVCKNTKIVSTKNSFSILTSISISDFFFIADVSRSTLCFLMLYNTLFSEH